MKLPRLKINKLLIAFKVFLVIAILIPTFSVYAQTQPISPQSSVQPIDTSGKTLGENTATVSSPTGDEKGKTKGLWAIIGGTVAIGLLLQAAGIDVFGGIDCVVNFGSCVEGAGLIVENLPYKQTVGCDFEMPENGRYRAGGCSDQKLQAYKNGVSFAQIPNPGALDIATSITNAAMEIPIPVRTNQYFASINPFKQVSAQSERDTASRLAESDVLLGIWQRVRNASYAFLVVILVVIGLMIMIRWRLDPRTVVTLQNSLPRLAVALILITFSFAISGFMADMVRVIGSIVVDLVGGQPFNIVAMVLLGIASASAAFASPFALLFTGWVGAIAFLFFAIVLLVVVLMVFISLIFKIVTRYVTFILLTIFAPLFFLLGALPGGEGITFTWLRRMAAALISIPAVAFVLQLSFVIGFSSYSPLGHSENVAPDLPGLWILPNPIFTIVQWIILGPVVGLGLFFFATKVPEIVDQALGVRPPPPGGIGPGAVLWPLGVAQGVGQAGKTLQGVSAFTGTKPAQMFGNIANIFRPRWCLSANSLIKTPQGLIAIEKLSKGMEIYSKNLKNDLVVVKIKEVIKRVTNESHYISHLRLTDGRQLFVSSTHPIVDGHLVLDLQVGSSYDGSIVKSNQLVKYPHKCTYDILPDSETGFYWAGGILMASTLSESFLKTLSTKIIGLFSPNSISA